MQVAARVRSTDVLKLGLLEMREQADELKGLAHNKTRKAFSASSSALATRQSERIAGRETRGKGRVTREPDARNLSRPTAHSLERRKVVAAVVVVSSVGLMDLECRRRAAAGRRRGARAARSHPCVGERERQLAGG